MSSSGDWLVPISGKFSGSLGRRVLRGRRAAGLFSAEGGLLFSCINWAWYRVWTIVAILCSKSMGIAPLTVRYQVISKGGWTKKRKERKGEDSFHPILLQYISTGKPRLSLQITDNSTAKLIVFNTSNRLFCKLFNERNDSARHALIFLPCAFIVRFKHFSILATRKRNRWNSDGNGVPGEDTDNGTPKQEKKSCDLSALFFYLRIWRASIPLVLYNPIILCIEYSDCILLSFHASRLCSSSCRCRYVPQSQLSSHVPTFCIQANSLAAKKNVTEQCVQGNKKEHEERKKIRACAYSRVFVSSASKPVFFAHRQSM